MSEPLPAVDKGTNETLNSIRSKVVQLIDSVYITQAMIFNEGNTTSLLPWPDILSRYTLLLSHTHSIISQLSQPPYGNPDPQAWRKNLANSIVSPVKPVEADKEWIVGTFLRTRQDVALEQEAARLIETLPVPLRAQAPQATAEDQPPDLELPAKVERLQHLIDEHASLASEALKHARKLRHGAIDDEDESHMQEDQFGGLDIDDGGEEADIPSYVWNMRLAEDEEDESIQGGAGGLFSPAPKSKATVNLTDVASFLRDGRKGPSFYQAL